MDQTKKPEHLIKLLLLGEQAVGKSSLIMRYTDNEFHFNIMGTGGMDLKRKKIIIENNDVKVMIYDTAGHERFRSIAKTQYKGSQGVILIYDVTERKSFDRVIRWIESIKEDLDPQNVEILLVGNKIDMINEKVVSFTEGNELAKIFGVNFIETSAKTGENVESAFFTIIKKIYDKEKIKELVQPSVKVIIEEKIEIKTKKSKCC
jgi:small GTP-binding protein